MKEKLLSILFIFILLVVAFSGCFEDVKKQDDSSKFYGTWRVASVSNFIGIVDLPISLTYYRFFNNGTGEYCAEGVRDSDFKKFNWDLIDDKLHLEYPHNMTEQYNYNFSIDFKALQLIFTNINQYGINPLDETEMILFKLDLERDIKPDIKIIPPVDIEITEYDMGPLAEDTSINVTWLLYNVTFGLRETKDIISDVLVRLNLYFYNNETSEWEQTNEYQKDGIYFLLEDENTTTMTLRVAALKPNMPYSWWYQYEERKINISVMSIYGITDTYEKNLSNLN